MSSILDTEVAIDAMPDPGKQILEVDDSGLLEKKKNFNTKVLPSTIYERKSFANNLYQIYEGKIISFIGSGNFGMKRILNQ